MIQSVLKYILSFGLMFILGTHQVKCQEDTSSISSKIENLNSDKDVILFLNELGGTFKNFKLKAISEFQTENNPTLIKKTADSLDIRGSYFKGDFDNNQERDLLVTGEQYGFTSYLIMAIEKDSVQVIALSNGHYFQDFIFPSVRNDSLIDIFSFSPEVYFSDQDVNPSLEVKTFTFKFGHVIEANNHPMPYEINKIEFKTDYCFGTCPVFSLELFPSSLSTFHAEAYNFEEKRGEISKEMDFRTNIKKESWEEITQILNYINFPELENEYAVNWTDDQKVFLTIHYDHGQVKTISDYGLRGTFGLNLLYQKLFDLRNNQDWEETN
ncbi:hypothetical protein IFO69_18660 [Echinicola sp. CAU 1574]|uniref:DUF6438 domain-containing protein n=1 Tax=Echinicola arenosa TaxID=2774144 RepID=A0ABR9AQ13_9BACT|nr:DUF6438 domain-containing protein [Echinicola arenosa]MBD8490780.1 hypothetical protein [Echinicola arenosa]